MRLQQKVDKIFTYKEYGYLEVSVSTFVKKLAKRFDISEEEATRNIERELKWRLMNYELKRERR